MNELLARRAFTAGSREYLWLDVVLAAMWRGDWAPFEATLREGLACASHADATGEEAGEIADELLTDFRYARDLITAVDAEAWLERVSVTAEQLHAFFERCALRERWSADLPAICASHPAAVVDLADALPAEGICSGAFDRFALALAGRAALFEGDARDDGSRQKPVDAAALTAVLAEHADVLAAHPAAECLPRLARIAAIDAVFEAAVARELTDAALRSRVLNNRLDWMRVAIERLAFPEASMAREALLCCRQDGLTLGQLAADINRRLECEDVLLQTCGPDMKAVFLSAAPGQVVGPVEVGDSHHVLVVRRKQPPVLEDPQVRALAEQAIVESLLDRERKARVRWGLRY